MRTSIWLTIAREVTTNAQSFAPGPIDQDLWMEGRRKAQAARSLGLAEAEMAAFLDGKTDLTRQLALERERMGWSNTDYRVRLQTARDLARKRLRETAAA